MAGFITHVTLRERCPTQRSPEDLGSGYLAQEHLDSAPVIPYLAATCPLFPLGLKPETE